MTVDTDVPLGKEEASSSDLVSSIRVINILLSGMFFWWLSLLTDTVTARFHDAMVAPALSIGAVLIAWLFLQTRTRRFDRHLFTLIAIIGGAVVALTSGSLAGNWLNGVTWATALGFVLFAMPLTQWHKVVNSPDSWNFAHLPSIAVVRGTVGMIGAAAFFVFGNLALAVVDKSLTIAILNVIAAATAGVFAIGISFPVQPAWRSSTMALGVCLISVSAELVLGDGHVRPATVVGLWGCALLLFTALRRHPQRAMAGGTVVVLTVLAYAAWWPERLAQVSLLAVASMIASALLPIPSFRRLANPWRALDRMVAALVTSLRFAFERGN